MTLFNRLFVSAFGAFAFVFPAFLISRMVVPFSKGKKKALEKAIKNKHVVDAVLVKKIYRHPDKASGNPFDRFSYRAHYEYEYKGRKYKYRTYSDDPPRRLTLYFTKHPSKANIEEHITDSSVSWPVVYAIVAVILFWMAGHA